ncbi:MAG: HAD family phosphatase [Clostridia bacterium]|nr:HAD family phosphatase [Clostridia bacterium]
MLENKKVIIFDLDGTLIDSIGVWSSIDIELIKSIGDGKIDDVDIGKQRDEKLKEFNSAEDMYLEYCGFLGEKYKSNLTKQEIKTLRYQIADKYLKEIIDYKTNAENVLHYLKEKGFILVLATTTNDHTIETYIKDNKNIKSKAPLDKIFSLIYSKGAVKKLKPDPEIHYKILNELNVKKEECLIVEDSLIGVEAAQNSGIDFVVMYDKFSDGNREEINKLSKINFNNFDEMLEVIKKEMEG